MNKEQLDAATVLARKILTGELAIFAGAGLSAGVGFVDWTNLLAPFAKELDLDATKERDNLVRLAQYSQNAKGGNRHHLNEALIKAFPVMKKPSENHEILARMPIGTYWTTNYDKLIETSIREARKVADVKWMDSQLPHTVPHRNSVVYKMHGDVESPNDAVLTRDDYEKYSREHPGFINALVGDLTVKTFLFIGFSFSDPNLDSVLSEVRQRYHAGQREHYCLIRTIQRRDYRKTSDYDYARARQLHFVADLRRFNITAISVDEYSDITEFLQTIERLQCRNAVFVAGSAHEYGAWPVDEAESFVRAIGSSLVDLKLKVVSGMGIGVGNLVVSGAVERIYNSGAGNLDSYLEVRPFPMSLAPGVDRDALWKKYRTELLQKAGIILLIFGNKLMGGKTVDASGMLEEFTIATAKGALPVAIGVTGFASEVIATAVLNDYEKYYPKTDKKTKKLLTQLSKPRKTLAEQLPDIRALLAHLSKDYV
jgi:hypothetical protein